MIQIKGISSISPFGLGVEKFISRFGLSEEMEKELIPPDSLNYKYLQGLRILPKVSQYGCISASEAFRFAGYPNFKEKDDRTGVIVSNNFGSLHAIKDMFEDSDKYGPNSVNPRFFPGTVLNVVAGHISIKLKLSGPNITISEGVYSGQKSLLYAYELLEQGEIERVIVCDLNIYPPQKYRTTVQDYLPRFEHVSTVLLEKVSPNNSGKNGVPIKISRSFNPIHQYNEIEAQDIIPHLLNNSYRILKEQERAKTYLSTQSDQTMINIELN
ncbi:beta-ketoacyl synthase N-terminal-like domain-containing protein [Bacillus sp. SM2101]|uniref:beta-ketoacyl synthase N-terminal-like domain-containing protein n=1 Tax=Bacillus sp. SM2101 TaxID=2805366 RepID=UPI001BDE7978|nr:beta-ketoacyl synthase N-terminal-like domain-containing protein [Bacillus sp. SM2101]